ncbi:MAG TPA: hypothetical protein H9694_02240 [Firmicutes bacterium]|nr:hypothetical protein [Bacillota bacterium]
MKACFKGMMKIGGVLLLCAAALMGTRCLLERCLLGGNGPMSEDFEE